MDGYKIAIDWLIVVHLAMEKIGLDACNFPLENFKKHETCQHSGKTKCGSRSAINLEDCYLGEFSKKEKMLEVSFPPASMHQLGLGSCYFCHQLFIISVGDLLLKVYRLSYSNGKVEHLEAAFHHDDKSQEVSIHATYEKKT